MCRIFDLEVLESQQELEEMLKAEVTTNVSPQVPWMGSPFGRMRPPTRHRIRGGAVNPAAVKRMEQ
jgi:hypothetical protein